MTKVRCIRTTVWAGEVHSPGSVLEVSEQDAQALQDRGKVVPDGEASKVPHGSDTNRAVGLEASDNPTTEKRGK